MARIGPWPMLGKHCVGFIEPNQVRGRSRRLPNRRPVPEWRMLWRLAWLAFAGLWVHALWRTGARGLSQRAVVVLIVAWLWLALRALRRTRR